MDSLRQFRSLSNMELKREKMSDPVKTMNAEYSNEKLDAENTDTIEREKYATEEGSH